ncbi:kinase-like domain-containing protein [Mycena vitilis]|nr:kinase-like domain-containing protein [Mycena vitilis]
MSILASSRVSREAEKNPELEVSGPRSHASSAVHRPYPARQDYDLMEEIGSGKASTVYLVNCKRGRLRNRQLALRKASQPFSFGTPAKRSEPDALSASAGIHLSLSHPCLVSLFSTFSTSSAHFHLLELCSGGTLSSYLEGRPLSEDLLAGVLKNLFEALVYLKNEGVVHRNVKPSNILLTTDGRAKLGDFGLATHLPPSKLGGNCFADSAHFVAPEILGNLPYACEADSWSVGCVALACLSGRVPFEATSNHETVDKVLNATYVLPADVSAEIQDLMVKLLETTPARRMRPSEALSHRFFTAHSPVFPLSPSLSKPPDSILRKHALFESTLGLSKKPFPHGRPTHSRHSYAPNKTTVDDIKNTRTSLCREILARRIVSDPFPLKRRHVTPPSVSPPKTSLQTAHPQNFQGRKLDQECCIPLENSPTDFLPVGALIATSQSDATIFEPIPVGTTRPSSFTTGLLSPEMHKTVHGQITVLPSHALLVDLREGERRRGQKGVEVLVIDSHGTQIEVYSAPHLSLPCCLAEPTERYTIENLPSTYWRQYNDAALLVERIKQRTPKLILHTGAAKCVLMANDAPGEIELSLGPAPASGRKQGAGETPRIRIRLSRQSGTLEIAKHLSGTRGEEWTKKVLKTVHEHPYISPADWQKLEATEQDSMAHLSRFRRTCEVLEQLEREEKDPSAADPYSPSGAPKSRGSLPENDSPTVPARIVPASFSSTPTLSINAAARPSKYPFLPATRKDNRGPSVSDVASIEGQHPSVIGKTGILPTWCMDDDDFDLPAAEQRVAQTKYIPSVGWCIRQSSCVSQGGRYKIMFFDGATLEIDVDEDWAELTSPSGKTTRHNIRECNAKRHIAERMKVFGDFVSMFDETEEG